MTADASTQPTAPQKSWTDVVPFPVIAADGRLGRLPIPDTISAAQWRLVKLPRPDSTRLLQPHGPVDRAAWINGFSPYNVSVWDPAEVQLAHGGCAEPLSTTEARALAVELLAAADWADDMAANPEPADLDNPIA